MKIQFGHINSKVNLKSNYFILFEIGLILSLSIVSLIFKLNISQNATNEVFNQFVEEIVFLEEVIQTKQEIKAPPPPRPVIPIEVPNDEIIEDEIIMMSSEINFDDIIPLPPPPLKDVELEKEEEIFVVVEQPPILIGGIRKLQQQVIYPELAINADIEGKVIVQFIIDREGNPYNLKVIRGIGGGCDEEALRVIGAAKFKPGMQRGKPVAVQYTISLNFKLKDKS